jgi:hypothetical protein
VDEVDAPPGFGPADEVDAPLGFSSVDTASTLACANSAARFDKVILICDSLFVLLKSLTFNLHVDIGASILKLVSVHPNFVA